MPAPTVVNIKNNEDWDVYIGRPSQWGNPFYIGKHGTREEVIEQYREYFYNNRRLLDELYYLCGQRLGCYCKPEACHGDVIVEAYIEIYGQW